MNHVDGLVTGELAVGCATTAGKYVLPGLLAAFQTQYPQVHGRLEVRNNEDVLAGLLAGQLALGLMSQVSAQPALEYQPFFEDHIILIVPAGHAWARFGHALPADLIDQPLIMQEPGSGTRAALLEALAQHAISGDMLHVVMHVSNAEAIETAVEEASGVAFISELAAEHGLALGRIKRVEVEGMRVLRRLYLVRDTDWPLTRAQGLFWRYLSRPALAPVKDPCVRPEDQLTRA
jgi:DNA-binding transcriptional LysR family regulator